MSSAERSWPAREVIRAARFWPKPWIAPPFLSIGETSSQAVGGRA